VIIKYVPFYDKFQNLWKKNDGKNAKKMIHMFEQGNFKNVYKQKWYISCQNYIILCNKYVKINNYNHPFRVDHIIYFFGE